MKTIHYSTHKYLGLTKEGLYAFQSIRSDYKPEIIIVSEARMYLSDGSVRYFNGKDESSDNQIELLFNNFITGTCVKEDDAD